MPASLTRHLLATALAAVMVAGLAACDRPAPAEPAAPAADVAAAPAPTDTAPAATGEDFYRFKVGTLDATVLRDGTITLPNDGKVIAMGEPKEAVDAVLTAAGQPTDQFTLNVQALLVRIGDRVVLFDTGAGKAAFADGGRLLQSLGAAGIVASQVTDVLISHAHGDHIGGLRDADGKPAFPAAKVRMSAPEWQAMQKDASAADTVAAISAQVETFEPGADVLPGVTSVPVAGHTPGHTAYDIADGDAHLLVIGDTAHHSVISVQQPTWTIQFDGDADTAEASREALLKRAAEEGLDLWSPHFPYPGVGRVIRGDDGYRWTPAG